MQQSAFGKGNFADSLFHMLFFPCAVIVDIQAFLEYFGEKGYY